MGRTQVLQEALHQGRDVVPPSATETDEPDAFYPDDVIRLVGKHLNHGDGRAVED
ncbi:MAG: hypothetical protein WA966_05515 [Ornithinimicrobium sp.]